MPDENQRLKDSSNQAGCRGGCHGNQLDKKNQPEPAKGQLPAVLPWHFLIKGYQVEF